MKYCVVFGLYSRSGHIMGTEDREIVADDYEDAKAVAKLMEDDMEEYYPCAMVDEIIELDEEEEEKEGLPF